MDKYLKNRIDKYVKCIIDGDFHEEHVKCLIVDLCVIAHKESSFAEIAQFLEHPESNSQCNIDNIRRMIIEHKEYLIDNKHWPFMWTYTGKQIVNGILVLLKSIGYSGGLFRLVKEKSLDIQMCLLLLLHGVCFDLGDTIVQTELIVGDRGDIMLCFRCTMEYFGYNDCNNKYIYMPYITTNLIVSVALKIVLENENGHELLFDAYRDEFGKTCIREV